VISFLRLRPAEAPTEVTAITRRKEGTTALEMESLDSADAAAVLAGGLLPVATRPSTDAAAWVVSPSEAMALAAEGRDGWRVTVLDDGPEEAVLNALARTEAAFLRTGRSRVGAASALTGLPGINAEVSVFVDSVEEAVEAISSGAGDLLLRDWDVESIGRLRDALDGALVERTAFPVGVPVDDARTSLSSEQFAVWLSQIDGAATARPRYSWAPGRDEEAPVPQSRFSAQWSDRAWLDARSPGLEGAGPAIRHILDRSLDGIPPDRDELELLFRARGREVDAIASVADQLRARTVGDAVTYVVNRNINYTNQCYFRCGFCAFSKGPRSLNLRGEPYLLEVHEVAHRAREAWEAGATEVCLQGGIHPEFTGDFYVSVVEAVKSAVPGMHVHGFTPLEVWQGAETLGIGVPEFLERLQGAGLGTLPGTAAEILDDRVRRHLCPDKITTSQWSHVMVTAHGLGLRSTATIMFGHIDDPASWANHFDVLRSIQKLTGGFTEVVPLPFVHMGAPIFLRGRSRPGPTWDEVVLIHSVARIAFDGLIPNIQASWVKLGLPGASRLLEAGCNDLGGTLMDENISRAAGASHGQLVSADEMEAVIAAVGKTPVRRNTLYEVLGTTD
jgi:7,8-didemethyl-8-hydroxy-5-deazariboflavin synthase CofH subunit